MDSHEKSGAAAENGASNPGPVNLAKVHVSSSCATLAAGSEMDAAGNLSRLSGATSSLWYSGEYIPQ